MMQDKKMNFFERIFKSMTNFEAYRVFFAENLSNAVFYLIFFSLLLGIISSIKPVIVFNQGIDFVKQDFLLETPYFELKEGQLFVDIQEPLVFEEGTNILVIDTLGVYDETILQEYQTGIVILKDKMVQKQNAVQQRTTYFEELKPFHITKTHVEKWFPYLKLIIFIIILFSIVGTLIGKFISTFFISLMGLIMNAVLKTNFRFGEIYKISIYSITTASLLKFILQTVGVKIPMFFFIYYGIVVIYLWRAMQVVKQQPSQEDDIVIDQKLQ